VLVVADKIGWFSLGLDESFGIEPFREFNVPIFARIDKSIICSIGMGFQSIWHIQESNTHSSGSLTK
jgi:hypothetical protein